MFSGAVESGERKQFDLENEAVGQRTSEIVLRILAEKGAKDFLAIKGCFSFLPGKT